jgi:hypothetical protein
LISAHELGTGIQDVAINPGVLQHEVVTGHPLRRSHTQSQRQSHFHETQLAERDRLDGKLKLQTLELERIPLSVAVLQKAFDWSILTNLTILDCAQHANLWLMLRRHFQPTALGISHASKHGANVQYHLNLKKIHTDAASPALISFLKETLAPNTLETLFLQDRRRPSAAAAVTIVSLPSLLLFSTRAVLSDNILTVAGCYLSRPFEETSCKSEKADVGQLRQNTTRAE